MGYLTAAIWFLVGLYLFRQRGENRVFLFLSLYFLYLGVWWAARTATGIDLFSGEGGVIFRCVTVVALLAALVAFFRHEAKFGSGIKQ
jgi:hypothetical protein